MGKHKLKITMVLVLLFNCILFAQQDNSNPPINGVKIISAVDVEEKIAGKPARASTVEVTLRPKDASLPHRHPGPVYGYVLEGEYEFKVEGKPLRLLKAGDTFYEPIMALHEVSRNPSSETITRVLAIVVHPRDAKNLVIPENK